MRWNSRQCSPTTTTTRRPFCLGNFSVPNGCAAIEIRAWKNENKSQVGFLFRSTVYTISAWCVKIYKHSQPQRTIGAFLMLLPHDERFLSCRCVPQKTLRLCRYMYTRNTLFFYLSRLLHSQVYKSSILSLNLFLFFLLLTRHKLWGFRAFLCTTRNLWTERNKRSRRTEGRKGRRRRMINKFQKSDCDDGSQLRFLVKRKLGSRLE